MTSPIATSWLDTETKAALQKLPPEKIAPATTETYSIVVLSRDVGCDDRRHLRAFDRVLRTCPEEAQVQMGKKPPFVVKRELTPSDAMLAQFELICCDVVSVFIRDTVIADAETGYLSHLYSTLLRADEFQRMPVCTVFIPQHSAGRAFAEQFIGPAVPTLPCEMTATRKKARIMYHWARKVGAIMSER